MRTDDRRLRLRSTRRDTPDLGKLIEWVLGIAEARHRAWVNGEPDPYGLGLPDGIGPEKHRDALAVPGNFRDRQPPKATAPHGITVVDIFHHRRPGRPQPVDDLSRRRRPP